MDQGRCGGVGGVEETLFARRVASDFAIASARRSGDIEPNPLRGFFTAPPSLPISTAAGFFGVVMRSTPGTRRKTSGSA